MQDMRSTDPTQETGARPYRFVRLPPGSMSYCRSYRSYKLGNRSALPGRDIDHTDHTDHLSEMRKLVGYPFEGLSRLQ